MGLLDLLDEILRMIVEQIWTEAFENSTDTPYLPYLDTLLALALTSRRFTGYTTEAIHREVRLIKDFRACKGESRWRCWMESCNKYPRLLDRVKALRVWWTGGTNPDLVDGMMSCLGRFAKPEYLSLSWHTFDLLLPRVGKDLLLPPNVEILEITANTSGSPITVTPYLLNRICRLSNLKVFVLDCTFARLNISPNGPDLDEVNELGKEGNPSKLEEIVFSCESLDPDLLNCLFQKTPSLKLLTIPHSIGKGRDEQSNWSMHISPTTTDSVLQPLTDTQEYLTIKTSREYADCIYPHTCDPSVGFSRFTALEHLDIPSHFLFDLSGPEAAHPRTHHDLLPKSLESLRIWFEDFFSIHELERDWKMTRETWHDDLTYSLMIDQIFAEPQQCQWIARLIRQDREALKTPRQVHAWNQRFDAWREHYLALELIIPGTAIAMRTTLASTLQRSYYSGDPWKIWTTRDI